ncbi:MAG: hypothetical protein WA001_05340 [Patescibacteria group bacterium]
MLLVGVLAFLAPHPATLPGACRNVPDEYQCVVAAAEKAKDPNLCTSLDAGNDDGCMADVYRQVNDPSICDKITHMGVKENCIKSFSRTK